MRLLSDYIQLCRLNRPIGVWLLLFPGFVGLSIGATVAPLSYFIIFIVGAVAMRSAGCIYNDIVDRPFDGKVERTKNRPLVRPENPVSFRMALAFLALNLIVGLGCLLLFSYATILVGLCAAAMIATYPWMKRITYWPQLFLGFTMNMGFVIGCFAINGFMSLEMMLIYLGMASWTLGYDTIYGFQDMEDDALIGVKSSSLRLRKYPRRLTLLMYIVTVGCWYASGHMLEFGVGYDIGLFAITVLLMWQALTLNIHDVSNCLVRFKINQWVGIILWCAVLMKRVL